MNDFDTLREQWNLATANLKYGEQRVFHDVLELVATGKKKDLIYGADYYSGGVCLVNAAGALLQSGGGSGVPMANFSEVVSLYDKINRAFLASDVNVDSYVTPLAADILLQWFAPLKDTPLETAVNEAVATEAFAEGLTYTEPTDEDMTRALMEMLSSPPPAVEQPPVGNQADHPVENG